MKTVLLFVLLVGTFCCIGYFKVQFLFISVKFVVNCKSCMRHVEWKNKVIRLA